MADNPTEEECGSSKREYKVPTKQIKGVLDIPKWEKSEAYQEYLGFIQAIGDAIKGKRISDKDVVVSERVDSLLGLLKTLSDWVDEIKPVEQEQRFGNQAFRDWHRRLEQNGPNLLKTVLTETHQDSNEEMFVYLLDSFGNRTRIDYGTGHEMAFVMFLDCLFQEKVFNVSSHDMPTVGLKVFGTYMRLARKLQQTYRMEPAGSQGVWALDDYQFVSFVWGAAQLMAEDGYERITPKSIPDYELADKLADDYHLFACTQYIGKVKTGPFAEHSNQLWNVSGVPMWSKVYTGLLKMYRAEVLSKFPVIQHTYFGSFFSLELAKNQRATQQLGMIAGRRGPPPGAMPRMPRMPPPKLP